MAQSRGCFEIKGLEFFVPASVGTVHWSEEELTKLATSEGIKTRHDYWLVPPLLKQLAEYYPGCEKRATDERFDLLLKLFAAVRPNVRFPSPDIPTGKRIEAVRDDFYRLLHDDASFSKLIYTLDDGPLDGEVVTNTKEKPLASRDVATAFGTLRIANHTNRVVVTAIATDNRVMWSRVLKGVVPERYLESATLDSISVEQTDFVTVARFYVDGEKLSLYVRPTGKFLYYKHSW